MRLLGATAVLGLVIVLFAAGARAQVYLGWADEFVTARVSCSNPPGSPDYWCTQEHFWRGIGDPHPVRWDFMGGQGSNLQGRRNAREKVMFNFRETFSNAAVSVTVELARWRVTPPPSPGSSCASGGFGTFLAGTSYTINSNQFPLSAHYHNHRLRPVIDFETEAGFGGQTVGYRSLVGHSAVAYPSGQFLPPLDQLGCFKIHWYP